MDGGRFCLAGAMELADDTDTMENRRKDYRHRLQAPGRLAGELALAGQSETLPAEVIDLSVGGSALAVPAGAGLRPGETCLVHLTAAFPRLDLKIPAVVVHRRDTPAGPQLGMHFPPLANPTANDNRERLLWRFLLEEQRRSRREAGGERRSAG